MSVASLPTPIARFSWRRWLIVRRWLERAWDPELERALHDGDARRAVRALANGANPNALFLGDPPVDHPEPALVMAARKDNAPLIQALIHFGAHLEARGKDMFQHTALATAVLGRKWSAARALVQAGASWSVPVWVLDPDSLPSAVAVSGAVDPSRVRSIQATLEDLVQGKTQSLRDLSSAQGPVSNDPKARELLSFHHALRSQENMEQCLPSPAAQGQPKKRF